MIQDHYATLGVAPRSDAATIRAAYLGLMRRYHPDKNHDPAATGLAQATIAAFAVLGDPELRLHYDWDRRRAAEAVAAAQRPRPGRTARALVAAVALLLLMVPFAIMRSPTAVRAPPVEPTITTAVAAAGDLPDPELRAIVTPPLAEPPVAPPPLEVAAEWEVQADAEVEARARAEAEAEAVWTAPSVRPEPRVAVRTVPAPTPRLARTPRLSPPPRTGQVARNAIVEATPPADIKAKCRSVKPGAETAICNNDNLSALDRTVVTFYNQSLSFGDAAKRTALLDARDSFLARREACRSDSCLRNAHLVHLREISAIAENRPPAPNR